MVGLKLNIGRIMQPRVQATHIGKRRYHKVICTPPSPHFNVVPSPPNYSLCRRHHTIQLKHSPTPKENGAVARKLTVLPKTVHTNNGLPDIYGIPLHTGTCQFRNLLRSDVPPRVLLQPQAELSRLRLQGDALPALNCSGNIAVETVWRPVGIGFSTAPNANADALAKLRKPI